MVETTAELPSDHRARQPKLTQPGGLHPDGGGEHGVRARPQPHRVCQEVSSEQLRHVHPAHRYLLSSDMKKYLKVIIYQSSTRPSVIFQAVESSYNHFYLRLPDPDLKSIFTWDFN